MTIDERTIGRVGYGGGPVLSDGTPVADLIDLENRQASLRLFSDPEVYQAEQEWLFSRCWNVLGHESEIPEPGDYVLRSIAQDPVIVSRDREGEIRVMLNVCTHRGMQVCRSDAGNASNFKCPYHGWVFDTAGNLLGAPFEKEMYDGSTWDKGSLGLRTARVDTYAGIIFANWSPTAPSLQEYLGDFSWYLDTIFRRTNNGLECIGAPQRFVIHGNWKSASEQFNGPDGYHAATLHRAMFEERGGGDPKLVQSMIRHLMHGIDVSSSAGGIRLVNPTSVRGGPEGAGSAAARTDIDPIDALTSAPPVGLPKALVPELASNLTPGQLEAMVRNPPSTGGMFPNVGFLQTNLRVHVPLGVNSFEMLNFVLVERDAPADFKNEMRRHMLQHFGTSGTFEQDDSEAWPAMQNSAAGRKGSEQALRYHAFIGDNPPDEWEGGGRVYPGFTKDDGNWDFWLNYRSYMIGSAD